MDELELKLKLERQSHDAEIKRLAYEMDCDPVIEDMVKRIRDLKQQSLGVRQVPQVPQPPQPGYHEYLFASAHVFDATRDLETVYARNLPGLNPLTVLRTVGPERACISRWVLASEHRDAIGSGCDLFVEQATFGGGALQPVRLAVGDGRMHRVKVLSYLGIHMGVGES